MKIQPARLPNVGLPPPAEVRVQPFLGWAMNAHARALHAFPALAPELEEVVSDNPCLALVLHPFALQTGRTLTFP